MTEAVIRLDTSNPKTKPFSECRGERAPDDPHYRVHFWQGEKVGKDMVLLPFDSEGILVPEDPARTVPYQGLVDGKPVLHYPLYDQKMRDLVARKRQRLTGGSSAEPTAEDHNEEERREAEAAAILDDINFVSWLRGEARYDWTLLQKAAKEKFGRAYTSKKEMVTDLVLDEKVVPEDQVGSELAKLLPQKAA